MRVAVVGSREYVGLNHVAALVGRMPPDTVVVSGAAPGVDRYAVQVARARDLATEEFPADWDRLGKRAGLLRNEKMIATVDAVIAFWDLRSRGTAHAIATAKRLRKKLRVYGPEGIILDPKRILASGKIAKSLTVVPPIDLDRPARDLRQTNPRWKGRGVTQRIHAAIRRAHGKA